MKGNSNIEPRRFIAADVAAWLAAYAGMSGLVDVNTYAFASVAGRLAAGPTARRPTASPTLGRVPLPTRDQLTN